MVKSLNTKKTLIYIGFFYILPDIDLIFSFLLGKLIASHSVISIFSDINIIYKNNFILYVESNIITNLSSWLITILA